MFRAQLILHDKVREVFEGSLRLARQSGYLKKRGMRVALDTTYILGRGAVKDTYNLLADGIVLLRVLAACYLRNGPKARGTSGTSGPAEATIDWSDRKARRKLLGETMRPAAGAGAAGVAGIAGIVGGGVAGTVAAPGRRAQGGAMSMLMPMLLMTG